MPFSPSDLAAFAAAEEVEIETRAAAGTAHRTTIWVVVAGDQPYIRSVRGARGRWYKEAIAEPEVVVHVDGRPIPVRVVPASDQDSITRTTTALKDKYENVPGLEPMLRSRVVDYTLRLEPA